MPVSSADARTESGAPQLPSSSDMHPLTAAVTAHQAGNLQQAIELYDAALRADPLNAPGWNLIGLAYLTLGQLPHAGTAFTRALVLDPSFPDALNHRAVAAFHGGQLLVALQLLSRALTTKPDFVEALGNCAGVLFGLAEWEQVVACCDRALGLRLDYTEAHANRANALQFLGRLDEARPAYRRALALQPALAEGYSNLASLDQAVGYLASAILGFGRSLALKPSSSTHSNLLFCLCYDAGIDNERLFSEFRNWEARYAAPVYPTIAPHAASFDPERPLRIGWLSADFREHPVARNTIGTIEHHDRAAFPAFLYGDIRTPDAVTDRFRKHASQWRDITGLADHEVAAMLREDRVDILIVLAGHTGGNRIGVAAHRPAPIQVSCYDLSTSGLAVMDAWLTDPILHPETTTERFTEKLVRLPCLFLHETLSDAPAPAQTPMTEKGHVTFGSFNNTSKMTPEVVAVWAQVLAAVPGSRLVLKYLNRFASPGFCSKVTEAFARRGIHPDRLSFLSDHVGRAEQLALYREIDIALDPFPFNGSTTTFESLWMGVPVVALAGERFLGRMSASLLHRIGLGDLVAEDLRGYVTAARTLAGNKERLNTLRRTLRSIVASSPHCDASTYTRNLESALRTLWRERCDEAHKTPRQSSR